jgi:cytochrome c peroxidase
VICLGRIRRLSATLPAGALMKVMVNIRWSALAAILGVTVSLAQTDDRGPRLLGLPEIGAGHSRAVSAGKVKLGRRLFFDPNLSADRKISCATCHQPDKAFADGKPLAEGVDGRRGARNTPSLINAGHLRTQFWDGRRASLEEQVLDPLFNPNEHGLVDDADLLRRIQADAGYRPLIQETFDIAAADIRPAQVSQALADFVRSVEEADSAADRYLFGGDHTALTPDQIRGLELFRGRAECATCHAIGERDALFTDHDYHSLSVGFDGLAAKLSVLSRRLAAADIRERDRLVK